MIRASSRLAQNHISLVHQGSQIPEPSSQLVREKNKKNTGSGFIIYLIPTCQKKVIRNYSGNLFEGQFVWRIYNTIFLVLFSYCISLICGQTFPRGKLYKIKCLKASHSVIESLKRRVINNALTLIILLSVTRSCQWRITYSLTKSKSCRGL